METPKNEPWNFCETPEEKCTMSYCDDNGCQNRKRVLVSEEIPDHTAQLKAKSLEEIRDIVAKNRGYENWEIMNGSDLYDSDIDEVARMYSEFETAQLKADKAELLEALQDIQDELENGDTPKVYKIESLIQKMKQ